MRLERQVSSKQSNSSSQMRAQSYPRGKETQLGSNLSRRNHYVAEFIVRNFAGANGRLHVFNKERGKRYQSKPKDVFLEKRRFVRYSDGGEQDDFEVEEQLNKIESAAAPAIRRILASARNGDFPKLSPEHQGAWKQFFFTSLLRTPEHSTRILNELGSEQALDDAINHVLQEGGFPALDNKVLELEPQWANVKGMARHNNLATFAAGLPPNVNSKLKRYSRQVGLLVGFTRDSSAEFILGSCGPVVIPSQAENDSLSGTWFPISYDVAIGLTAFPDREYLLPLGPTEVQRINSTSYEQSEIIAARSKSQLQPFIQKASN